jgi:hypothetical protein
MDELIFLRREEVERVASRALWVWPPGFPRAKLVECPADAIELSSRASFKSAGWGGTELAVGDPPLLGAMLILGT